MVHPPDKGSNATEHALLLTSLPELEAFVNIYAVCHGPPLVNMVVNLRTVSVELAAWTDIGLQKTQGVVTLGGLLLYPKSQGRIAP